MPFFNAKGLVRIARNRGLGGDLGWGIGRCGGGGDSGRSCRREFGLRRGRGSGDECWRWHRRWRAGSEEECHKEHTDVNVRAIFTKPSKEGCYPV